MNSKQDIQIPTLTDLEFDQLCRHAQILGTDRRGPKVFQLADGRIGKLFTPRPLWSRARWRPNALRFARNASKLGKRGFVTVGDCSPYLLSDNTSLVIYTPIPGATLVEQLDQAPQHAALLGTKLGQLLADLHARGVYFRAVHPSNIIVTPDQRLGLIDIADLQTFNGPLKQGMRVRNFRHLLWRKRLVETFQRLGQESISEGYARDYQENASILPDFDLVWGHYIEEAATA